MIKNTTLVSSMFSEIDIHSSFFGARYVRYLGKESLMNIVVLILRSYLLRVSYYCYLWGFVLEILGNCQNLFKLRHWKFSGYWRNHWLWASTRAQRCMRRTQVRARTEEETEAAESLLQPFSLQQKTQKTSSLVMSHRSSPRPRLIISSSNVQGANPHSLLTL